MLECNPLDTMIETMNEHGSKMELKQRMPDGTYQTTSKETIQALNLQAKFKTIGNSLSLMTKEEKNNWAITKKNQGNEFYFQHLYKEAIETYLEVLSLYLSLILTSSLFFSLLSLLIFVC